MTTNDEDDKIAAALFEVFVDHAFPLVEKIADTGKDAYPDFLNYAEEAETELRSRLPKCKLEAQGNHGGQVLDDFILQAITYAAIKYTTSDNAHVRQVQWRRGFEQVLSQYFADKQQTNIAMLTMLKNLGFGAREI